MMSRKLKNRYRLKIGGLTLNLSLLKEYTDTATDFEIAESILRHFRFLNTLEALRDGMPFDLKMTRASKGKAKEGEK